MKKRTKILITAAAVAAVVGVSAVSFAAWNAGSKQSQEVSGSTGSINTIGTLTVTPKENTFTKEDDVVKMNALFPVDQTTENGLPTGGLTYWEFEVAVTGDGAQTVTVKADVTQTEGGDAALFYSTDAPSGAAVTGAKPLTSAQEITGFSEDKKATVYVYMTSGNTKAMNATITLTFEATATEVA